MQYALSNNKWVVTYTDSNGFSHSFLHPTQLTKGQNGPQTVTEEIIRLAFPTDAETESYVNYMRANDIKFDDDSQP